MSKHNVVEWSGRDTSRDELTELDREGAGKLIREALEAEVSELLSTLSGRRDASSRAAVVRNGYQPARDIQTGIGPVTVKVPKVRSRDGKPVSFRSALVPPYVRKSASLEAALPWLYLKGISTAEMAPVLEVLVGAEAKGLSASTVSRLKQQWREDYEGWRHRRLDKDQWVYIWADGTYSGLRAERQRLRGFVPKTANVLNKLPKGAPAKTKSALHQVSMAPTRASKRIGPLMPSSAPIATSTPQGHRVSGESSPGASGLLSTSRPRIGSLFEPVTRLSRRLPRYACGPTRREGACLAKRSCPWYSNWVTVRVNAGAG